MPNININELQYEKSTFSSQILREIRIADSFYIQANASAPWGFDNPPLNGALFHFIVEGSAEIENDEGEYITLSKGDLVLLPRGEAHILRSGSNAPVFSFDDIALKPRGENASFMSIGKSNHSQTKMICGGLSLKPTWHPLIESLPKMLIQKASSGTYALHFQHIISLMENEVYMQQAGSEAIINRLNEVLIISILRNWLLEGVTSTTGWIYALRDPFFGKSIVDIHRYPEKNWSVSLLAKEAKMSRAAFAEQFHKLVGVPPMHYVMKLRMNLAADKLQQTNETIECIASSVGYHSIVSFHRAFKRYWGEPPGKFKSHSLN